MSNKKGSGANVIINFFNYFNTITQRNTAKYIFEMYKTQPFIHIYIDIYNENCDPKI